MDQRTGNGEGMILVCVKDKGFVTGGTERIFQHFYVNASALTGWLYGIMIRINQDND